nr:LpqB family beta-propeller domain-containing protein [Streptomyces xiaopingdaonensis]
MRSELWRGRVRAGGVMTHAGGRRTAVLLSAFVLLVTGCASMPDGGSVNRVSPSQSAQGDAQVRVFSVSPQKGESAREIVRGFLEATTSDEAAFRTAREYLTEEMAKSWKPFEATTVLAGGPSARKSRTELSTGDGYTVEVTGRRIAEIDANSAYSPADGTYRKDFHLTKVEGEWRIDSLPDGLVLGESDFQRIYRPINNYYFASLGPDAESVTRGEDVLVADPVYLRRRINAVTETVKALLKGPSNWMAPVVSSSFPPGTRLVPGQHLSLDDSGALTVRLNAEGANAGRTQCARMAAQVLHTVQSQASAEVSKVVLNDPDGGLVCEQTREIADDYEPGRLNGRAKRAYLIDEEHRVASLGVRSESSQPVGGPLGSGGVEMGAVAVNRPEGEAAAVTRGRRALYVASIEDGGGALREPVVSSEAKTESDRLTAPSWDGLGDLWVADQDPEQPRLMRVRGGREDPEEVPVADLGKDERIEAVKIASDGVRIALQVRDAAGDRSLRLGRVERGGSLQEPQVAVADLRPLAPQLEDVVSASWAGHSTLVVVGRESGGVQQLQYLETDGSISDQPTLPGINDVTGVAASEEESRPLLAETREGIVRLPPDANWKMLSGRDSSPAYPG